MEWEEIQNINQIVCASQYFLIETDRTAIGENVLHKAVGIIILALVLKRVNLTWSDIGFQRNGFVSSILKGLLLGSVCFAISYWLELTILALQGNPAHLEIYISSFSLTGSGIKNTDFVFFLLCVVFNVLNVWMEEGIFRGLFIKIFSESKSFMQANFIAAFLFGVWHIVMPVRSCMDGEISFAAMVLMGIGYIILAGIIQQYRCYKYAACHFSKWCRRITNCPDYGCTNNFLCFCTGNLCLQEQEKEGE